MATYRQALAAAAGVENFRFDEAVEHIFAECQRFGAGKPDWVRYGQRGDYGEP